MAKKKEDSKKFIISCRVNDDEMDILRQRAHQDGVSITQLLRNCLNFADSRPRRQGFCETKQAC
ncbi:hypothetical protein [Malonomonas rubra]|uniref:hypothetical protein n=1 Tax=Malonomonas rubra TaxID=57040 RepID=UPI0026EF705E|nr:hypothetical protein [Malonomonas rubra]